MSTGFVASVRLEINAPVRKVWEALSDPVLIKKYMFDTEVISEWKEGSLILWKGVWEGKTYQDKGVIIRLVPFKILELTHFSPLAGVPDKEENYHRLVFTLTTKGTGTMLHFTQDNNPDKVSRDHSQKNWQLMFQNLRDLLENQKPR
jgi:uncharacterized protein YndB with AHSA1/START domain